VAVRTTLRESEKVGLPPSREEAQELTDLLEEADHADWTVLTQLEADLGKVSSLPAGSAQWMATVLRAVAPDRGDSLEAISNCLLKADQWLGRALETARARSDSAGDAAALEVRKLLQEWATLATPGEAATSDRDSVSPSEGNVTAR